MSDELKRKAASSAINFIESSMVVGLGTGSTSEFFIEELSDRINGGSLTDLICISSSRRTDKFASELSIELHDFKKSIKIDVNVDGADEVDEQFNLIKGGGGALLREKILAQASNRNIVIIDESKLSDRIGTKWSVPVEVLPFGLEPEMSYLGSLGADATVRKNSDGEHFLTDQNNYIIDCNFGPIQDPEKIAALLNNRAGIIEHGIFIGLATDIMIGTPGEVVHLNRD